VHWPAGEEVADALGMTMNELAGRSEEQLNLTGQWWTAWQTWTEGEEILTTQPAELEQIGRTVRIRALERSEENVRAGYVWSGELRLWDNQVLMGWYTSEDENVRVKGTLFYVLHPHGNFMEGRWVGLSYDGPIVSGWASVAQSRDQAASIVERLKHREAE
jgi:hypothetical protein